MKKIILVLSLLLLVGCTGDSNQSQKIDTLESLVNTHQVEVEDLEQQIKALEERLMEKDQHLDQQVVELEVLGNDIDLLEQSNQTLEDKISRYEDQLLDYKYEIDRLSRPANNYNVKVLSEDGNHLSYILSKDPEAYEVLTIIGQGDEFIDETYERMPFGDDSGAMLAVTVSGTIYNVRLVNFEFNEDFSETKITNIEASMDLVHNTILEIYSMFPEGIPYEMLIWEDERGIEHSYMISEDGFGFSGFIITD